MRHPGHDVRVFVLRGDVIGAMRRRANRVNGAPTCRWAGMPSPAGSIRRPSGWRCKAAHAIGAEMAGVDLILDLDRDELVVLEVNAVPGWRALARVTGVDVAALILAASERWAHEPTHMNDEAESSRLGVTTSRRRR